jgi:hypothetical protein
MTSNHELRRGRDAPNDSVVFVLGGPNLFNEACRHHSSRGSIGLSTPLDRRPPLPAPSCGLFHRRWLLLRDVVTERSTLTRRRRSSGRSAADET